MSLCMDALYSEDEGLCICAAHPRVAQGNSWAFYMVPAMGIIECSVPQ